MAKRWKEASAPCLHSVLLHAEHNALPCFPGAPPRMAWGHKGLEGGQQQWKAHQVAVGDQVWTAGHYQKGSVW